jgi:hypothetical protein
MWDSQLCVYRVLMSFCVPCEWRGGGGGGAGGGLLAQGPNEPAQCPQATIGPGRIWEGPGSHCNARRTVNKNP